MAAVRLQRTLERFQVLPKTLGYAAILTQAPPRTKSLTNEMILAGCFIARGEIFQPTPDSSV